MPARRGEIYLLDPARLGGRLRKVRPVLVLQNDAGNRYSPETIVAAIRERPGGRLLPVFVPLSGGMGGVRKDSVVDLGHIHTVWQGDLGRRLGKLSVETMTSVDRALQVSLGLGG